jgi:hypothetical protein
MNTSNLPGEILVGVGAITIIIGMAALALPRPRRRKTQRLCVWTVGFVVGAYLVGRAIAEFFVVNYNDPGSYSQSWGGPSMAGVFAVHSGPGLVVLLAAAACRFRKQLMREEPVTGRARRRG